MPGAAPAPRSSAARHERLIKTMPAQRSAHAVGPTWDASAGATPLTPARRAHARQAPRALQRPTHCMTEPTSCPQLDNTNNQMAHPTWHDGGTRQTPSGPSTSLTHAERRFKPRTEAPHTQTAKGACAPKTMPTLAHSKLRISPVLKHRTAPHGRRPPRTPGGLITREARPRRELPSNGRPLPTPPRHELRAWSRTCSAHLGGPPSAFN